MKKNYFKISCTMALITGLALITPTSQAIAAEFAVIVNAANSMAGSEDEMRRQVKRIFMKQQSAWPGNVAAFPLDRSPTDAAHQAFLKNILGKTTQEMASHWLQVKQQQGTTPPRVVGASRILLRLVGKKEGGMGIVNVDDLAGAPTTIKVLFRFND
ncbi:MAG: hypothetical protein COB49_09810 [Alphaproteobacteria bacterium]|nr:MAG: hypothetical protein COB49_09810 [Alphaproteobacteria bacterium]